jgi:dipeptidyl aminopeptidase/acylaminoacyl peptidase
MIITAPFGSWQSPISAADTVSGVVRFSELQYHDGVLSWLEGRPSEGGRNALVRRLPDGTIEDVLPATANVRTMVHEYGGGAYRLAGSVIYSEFTDQRLYRLGEDGPFPLTGEPPRPRSVRYADVIALPDGPLLCVRETHPDTGEAVNDLVRVREDGTITPVAAGSDFYSSPRLSPNGALLTWVEWNHPNMPWDGTRLVLADADDPSRCTVVAGGDEESVVQPEWAPDGTLVFASDRSGWWNLYRYDGQRVAPLCAMEAEFAGPAWLFGLRWFGFLSEGRIAAVFWEGGEQHLGVIHADGTLRRMDLDYSSYGAHLTTDGEHTVWFVGSHPKRPTAVVEYDVDVGVETVVRSNPVTLDEAYVPVPRLISFPTTDGDEAHAVYYPPTNPDYQAPDGERAPLIVHIHGGPTSAVSPAFSMETAYWTTRGIGIVDVNYRGSTGFGRDYRRKLEYRWGLVDVDDAVAAAEYLASIGDADVERLAISGGSAGGYTTLAALAFRDTFGAGASYYGVADIELLAADTHKFESRYEGRLVGTDPAVVRARSPIHSVDRITVPVALFQGLEDKVVPPNQTTTIAEALAARDVPHVHVEYEGEGHGFRKAENVAASLETELAFYGAVFGFTPAGDLPALDLRRG